MTPAEIAKALAETVMAEVVGRAGEPGAMRELGGVPAALDRADRAVDGLERWAARLAVVGIPIAIGIYLLTQTELTSYGLMALAAGPVLLLIWLGLERVFRAGGRAFDRAVDRATDPAILRGAENKLLRSIEQGELRVTQGSVRAELEGATLTLHSGGHAVQVRDVRDAWQRSGSKHLVIGEAVPGLRPDVEHYAVLPLDGELSRLLRS